MKRTLLLASLLGLLGSALYAQNAAGEPSGIRRLRTPNAQVTVTPGPQGLPIVNSSASGWPLGPRPLDEDALDSWLNGAPPDSANSPANGEPASGVPQDPVPPVPPPRPSFEPPPQGGLPSFAAPRPGPPAAAPAAANFRTRQAGPASGSVTESAVETQSQLGQPGAQAQPVRPSAQTSTQTSRQGVQTQPSTQTSRQGVQTQPVRQNTQTVGPAPKNVVVVPSPVHYDRAGRRVVDPDWQYTLAQMIQADRDAAAAAASASASAAAAGETVQEETKTPEAAPEEPQPMRETVIVVPGPALWRIRGTLTVAKGMLALEDSEGITWYLPGLDRYIGFIDGLDAGQDAALEGYAPPNGSSQERYFQALKLILDNMAYDLSIPPYGLAAYPPQNTAGQTTIIREVERREGVRANRQAGKDPGNWDDEDPAPRERRRSPHAPSQPVWEHNHKSPWAPPAGVLDFDMDYGSFWREDPAKQERRDRESREIWY